MEHIIGEFVAQGFRRFYVSVNYLGHMIEEYFGDGRALGVQIDYLHETKRLGTGGALDLLPEGASCPMIVMNGDLLTDMDFTALLSKHEASGAAATMCVRAHDTTIAFGVVEFDEEGSYQRTREKPTLRHYINAGIYCLSRPALETVPHDRFFDMPDVFEALREADEPCAVHKVTAAWTDIGTRTEYERVQKRYRSLQPE